MPRPARRNLLSDNSTFFANELLHSKRQIAAGILLLRTDLLRRTLRRYALWLYGSGDFATFDPSLTTPEIFLELSNLHVASAALQDEIFGNEVIDLMITQEMLLEDFLAEFLRTNAKGSKGRKLIVGWITWSTFFSDVKPKALLKQIQDASFCRDLAKGVFRKMSMVLEGEAAPKYLVSPCFYHIHSQVDRGGCGEEIKDETEDGDLIL
jgi:hypothetical protein